MVASRKSPYSASRGTASDVTSSTTRSLWRPLCSRKTGTGYTKTANATILLSDFVLRRTTDNPSIFSFPIAVVEGEDDPLIMCTGTPRRWIMPFGRVLPGMGDLQECLGSFKNCLTSSNDLKTPHLLRRSLIMSRTNRKMLLEFIWREEISGYV